jgi:hypothetical protein
LDDFLAGYAADPAGEVPGVRELVVVDSLGSQ